MKAIIERWNGLRQNIEKLQQQPPLAVNSVRLIAVSKAQTIEAIATLIDAGQRDFAENRVQEALEKWPVLLKRHAGLCLHLIGSLQTNKVKEALSLFNVIETIDRTSLVDAIAKHRTTHEASRTQKFFIQVNTGEEPQKGGVSPQDAPALLAYCRAAQLPVSGLMCVPPVDELPAPHFALLHAMTNQMGLAELSMGMSSDYETAIRMGATQVRVGTALFGERA